MSEVVSQSPEKKLCTILFFAVMSYLLVTGVMMTHHRYEQYVYATQQRIEILVHEKVLRDSTIQALKYHLAAERMVMRSEGLDPALDSMFIADKKLLLLEEQQRDSLLQLIRCLEMGI